MLACYYVIIVIISFVGVLRAFVSSTVCRIKVAEVKKHHDEWSDEEVPNSQRPQSERSVERKEHASKHAKKTSTTPSARKSDENSRSRTTPRTKKPTKVAWPPKKNVGKSSEENDEEIHEHEEQPAPVFPDSG